MIGNFSMLTSPLGYFSARPLPTSRRIIETMDKTTLAGCLSGCHAVSFKPARPARATTKTAPRN
jgi:hypothetical protein